MAAKRSNNVGEVKRKKKQESRSGAKDHRHHQTEAGNEEGAVCLSLVAQWLFGTLLYIKAAACTTDSCCVLAQCSSLLAYRIAVFLCHC